MGFGSRIAVLLGHSKVNDENFLVLPEVGMNQKVIRLDVAVDEVLFVDRLYSSDLYRAAG